MNKRPLLSIGMIFRNEIHCLERCLESLEPLRRAVSCELVMADTGSTDGSREVAAKYADILFDFPWVNDFSAARNAVMDRSSGVWYLTVDADEWLDGDISQLTAVLASPPEEEATVGLVVQRNYSTYDFDGPYTDFLAGRLVYMSRRPRYTGVIHERWQWRESPSYVVMRETVLHHDGYVSLNREGGGSKETRNMELLREKLKDDPEDLMTHIQMVESGQNQPDFPEILHRAVELVEERRGCWETMGPPILRYAVFLASTRKMPELPKWIREAEEMFPDSAFTQMDVAFIAFSYFLDQDDYEEAARRGERYLKALEEDRAGRLDPLARVYNPLQTAIPLREQAMKVSLADVYRRLDRGEEALALLSGLDYPPLDGNTAGKLARTLMNLQVGTDLDLSRLVTAAWEGICAPRPSQARAEERKAAFYETALAAFSSKNREAERGQARFIRHTYTMFLPLQDRCELGRGAALLETEDARAMGRILAGVENWRLLPGAALAHALNCGVTFPLTERPLNLEEMDILAARLIDDMEAPLSALLPAETETPQDLAWARGLVLAAVRSCKWDDGPHMELARLFAETEGKFLPLCYAPEALREENLFLLPPMHRFGRYCARAFDALDGGDTVGYVRLLRAGLASCESMKPMAEFLTRYTPQLRAAAPSPELLELAEKVRGMLAAFSPDDPAVAALKNSPAYQKVAHLLEAESLPAGKPQAGRMDRPFEDYLADYPAMSKMLRTYGHREILERAAAMGRMKPAELAARPMGGYSKGMTSGAYYFVLQDLLRNTAEYDWLYSRLEDDASREVFTNLMRYRLLPAQAFLQAAYDPEHPQYFDKGIVSCDENEVYVDCGGYTGDTAERYIRQYGAYKHIYVYEPDPENVGRCRENLKKYRDITVKQCGVGERADILAMDSQGASATFMKGQHAAEEQQGVPIISLDEEIQEPITYCKMDIEGFEIPALLGASRHIREDFPKLAICVYHILTDIWEVPRLIDRLHPGYRFFLRHYDPNQNWETVIYAIPPETDRD